MAGPLLAAAAFLLGAVPFGYLIGRAAGVDVRRAGSGNIGTANVARTVGWGAGMGTLALDMGKGAAAVALARWGGASPEWLAAAAAAAVLGHAYTPFLRFRGGKGVATTLGGLLAASWPVGLAAVGLWLALVLAFRFTSLAALAVACGLPFLAWGLDGRRPFVAVGAILAVLLIWWHRENIRRLREGTEPRIGQRHPAPAGPRGS